jgi:zinc protease
MKKSVIADLLSILLFLFICSQGIAQQKYPMNPGDIIPVDSQITIGKLPNGLTYYIRENHKPEKRAELRLAVRVGSVQEDDDQLGLAHLCEHMAFDGTKNFPKKALTNYLESIGMKLGPDINASTSFDRTVYMIQVPTDSMQTVQKAFRILEDWGHNISYDNEEIDKERKVVVEEWRMGRGANERMYKKQLPFIYWGSRYAVRDAIGDKKILDSCSYETLKRFYKDWYRPELMAVVAVGDFDKKKIEELIKEDFSKLTNPDNPRPYIKYPLPGHEETLYAIATDKEAQYSNLAVLNKIKSGSVNYVSDFRRETVEVLFAFMLSWRLYELAMQPDALFASGGASMRKYIGDSDAFTLQAAGIKDNKMTECLDLLLAEYERVRKFGFTPTEFERAKTTSLRTCERVINEKDKTESRALVDELLRNFLQDETIPGIQYEYDFQKKYLPTITLDEINALTKTLMTDSNRVIAVSMPEKEGLHVPTETELRAVVESKIKKELKSYEDKVSNKPLLEKEPMPSPVINEKYIKEIDVTEWTLANGVKVVIKPTTFKNDEIFMSAYGLGGSSLADDKDYESIEYASGIINMCGVGNYNITELQKYLAGKIVRVFPYIGELDEGLTGNCSPKDLETMLQLTYLYFTSPRKDSTGYLTYKMQLNTMFENKQTSPEKVFQDSLMVTLYDHHPRRRPLSTEIINKFDLQKSFEFYKSRFANASDFTFFIVGNIKKEELKPMIEKYIGSLPATKQKETWRDVNAQFAQGIEKTVYKGIEPKSYVEIAYSGKFDFTPQNRWEIKSMCDVLNIKLREVIREEKSGTYGVSAYPGTLHFPMQRYIVTISFGCNPERVEELTKAVYEQIDSLKNFGPKDTYITKVKETQKRSRETNLKENRYWLTSLYSYYYNGEDPTLILGDSAMADKLTPAIVQKRAKETFGDKNFIKVVLYPEKK